MATTAESAASQAVAPLAFAIARRLALRCISEAGEVMLGHPVTLKRIFASIFAGGHVLLDDVPGVGKTTLARTVAQVLGAQFRRIQFTADLLPSDITGVQVLAADTQTLRFRPGPIFAEMILADEINRASPKAQSAMLEAMAERRVTVDEQSYALPPTFAVLATQNPSEQHGVYPLPESQLDRFMLCTQLGYPSHQEQIRLLLQPQAPQARLTRLTPACDTQTLVALQRAVQDISLPADIAAYIVDLAEASRRHAQVRLGLSPRATLAMAACARAWAMLEGREYVLADDVQALVPYLFAHRLALVPGAQAMAVLDEVVAGVAVPR